MLLRTLFSAMLLKSVCQLAYQAVGHRCLCKLAWASDGHLCSLCICPLQTGAGKTFSLSSIAADAIGMIPRAAAEIFSHIESNPTHEYTVYMSYVQLYMELIQVGTRRKAGECRVGWWGIAGQRGAQHRLCMASRLDRSGGRGVEAEKCRGLQPLASSRVTVFNLCQECALPTAHTAYDQQCYQANPAGPAATREREFADPGE